MRATDGPVIAYVADAGAAQIAIFRCDAATGAPEHVGTFALRERSGPLAIAPDRRIMYAVERGETAAIAALAIAPGTGALRRLGTTPAAALPVFCSTDRAGRFLFTASYTAGSFAVHPIAADGTIGAPIHVERTPPHAHCIVTDPANRALFVTALGGDVILQFGFDVATGSVRPNPEPAVPLPPGTGPRHLVFHPRRPVAYVNGELDGSITVFALDAATGRLSVLQRVRALPPDSGAAPWAAEIAVTPDGRFLFASERRTSTLAAFAIREASGLLDPRGTIATERQPRSFAVEPAGRFALVAGELSGRLRRYAIERDGALLERECVAAGSKPVWVSVVALPV